MSTEKKQNETKLFKQEDSLMKRLWNFQCQDIHIEKDKTAGKGSFAYKYATLDGLCKSIKPYLRICGIGYYHKTMSLEGKDYLTTVIFSCDNKQEENIKTCVTEIKDGSLPGQNAMQSFGSKITYLKRYHLSMLLGLTTEEDNDAGAKKDNGYENQKQKVDYVTLYKNNIYHPKANYETIIKSFNTTKVKMKPEEVGAIEAMLADKFNDKKQ